MKPLSFSARLLGALVFLGLGPLASAAAEPLSPRRIPDKRAQRAMPRGTPVERLVVKFHEGTRVRLRGDALVPVASERSNSERSLLAERGLSDPRLARDVRSAQALMERAPRMGGMRRLFTEEEPLLETRKGLGEFQGGQQLADLNLYYEVTLLPGTSAEGLTELVDALNALDSVELAYVQPPAEPAMVGFGMLAAADIAPTTPLYEGNQGYLNAAPLGVDARYAWTVPGGTGAGVRVVDIEGGWRTSHEDMPGLFTQIGTQYNDLSWRNHGTAVLGEIAGVANGYGVTGIANAASVGVSSIGSQSSASAIASAAGAVGRGGVILIELHAQGPADSTPCTCNQTQCNFIAMEYWQANYDAIATATANGVTVVEAAGNGSANLDDATYRGVFNRNTRDSGAILVGASTATTRVPMCWTNFGSRVDVHGWGEQVVSLGYGDLFSSGEDQYYTSKFSGTSSASPIVTGSAVSLQGAALARNGAPLEPRYLRALLASTGTAQASDARNIGPLPNLRLALQQLNAFKNGMLLSDHDTGLAINADGGAVHGAVLKLSSGCKSDNPDCTWVYKDGMLVSSRNTTLAINAWSGAMQGTVLKLHSGCRSDNPDCTWTYKNGMFLSDTNPTLAINAYGGAQDGTVLKLDNTCNAGNPDCTWTYKGFMFLSGQGNNLWVNAYGGAANGAEVQLNNGCTSDNPDCTWTFKKGMLLSDRNPSLAINAHGGAQNETVLKLNSACTPANPDCTWTYNRGGLSSDTDTRLRINAYDGARNGTVLKLYDNCPLSNQDCTWTLTSSP